MEDNFVDNRSTFSNGALLSVLRNAFSRHECYNEQLSKLEWRTCGRIAQAEKNTLFGDGLLRGNFPCAARLARMHLLKTHPLAEKHVAQLEQPLWKRSVRTVQCGLDRGRSS